MTTYLSSTLRISSLIYSVGSLAMTDKTALGINYCITSFFTAYGCFKKKFCDWILVNRVNFVASSFLPGGVLSKAKVCLQWRTWWVGSASVRKWGLLWSHEATPLVLHRCPQGASSTVWRSSNPGIRYRRVVRKKRKLHFM